MIEKRKYIRLHSSIGIVYDVIKNIRKYRRNKTTLSLVKNLSGGGVRLQVKDDLRSGDLLDIEVQIPHLEESVHAIGEVVWFSHSKSKDHESKEAGIRFRDIDAKDLHRILEFVHTVGIG